MDQDFGSDFMNKLLEENEPYTVQTTEASAAEGVLNLM
jgi:hypothetical protein